MKNLFVLFIILPFTIFRMPAQNYIVDNRKMEGVKGAISPYENIQQNQMIFGYYRTSECLSDEDSGYGGPRGGTYKVCVGFTKEQMKAFVGNKITNIRFALVNTNVQEMKVWIGSTRDLKDLLVQNVNELKTGWNEVALKELYQITGEDFYMGIEYKQNSRNYPISVVSTGAESGSSYFYGPYNGENNYSWIESDEESVSIQCIVEGNQLPMYDVHAIKLIVYGKYWKAGGKVYGDFYLRNWGKNDIYDGYDLSVRVDGKEVDTYHETRLLSGSSANIHSFDVWLKSSLRTGKHDLSVVVTAINGKAQKIAVGKTAKLSVYAHGMERQKILIDHFTATWCPWCPRTDRDLENLMSERDDIALISTHSSDRMSCDAGEEYLVFTDYLPATFYNRYASIGANSLGLLGIDNAKRLPAFADVNISSSYNTATRQLNIEVNGTKNEDFDAVEEYTNLTVVLTEDNVVSAQYDGDLDQTITDYKHQGVLRTNVSAIWGDPLVWDGNHYSKTYSVVLDEDWVPENMNIVAYLAKPFTGSNYNEIGVVNCNSERIDFDAIFIPSAITSIGDNNPAVLKSYDVFGRQVKERFKGVNIIHMSDGTVKKVLVK